jgi:hypothetical protein
MYIKNINTDMTMTDRISKVAGNTARYKVYAVITKPENRCGVETATLLARRPDTLCVYFAYLRKYKLRAVKRELHSVSKGICQFLPYESPEQFESEIKASRIDGIFINKHGCNSPNDTTGILNDQGLLPFASYKLISNAILIDLLIAKGKLSKGSRVIVSGSESVRGIKNMGFPVPHFDETVESFVSYMDGSGFVDFNANMGYSYHMAISALMIGALSRCHPEIYFATVSPGFTRDSLRPSNVAGVPSVIYAAQFILSILFPLMILSGTAHTCNVAASRFVDALVGTESWKYPSGTSIGALEGISGPFGDLSLSPDGEMLGKKRLQALALQAVLRFVNHKGTSQTTLVEHALQ